MSRHLASSFVFAGIDLVLGQDGEWVVLEANDHPSGLLEADRLSGGTAGLVALSSALADRARNGTICLLLPDCFYLQPPSYTWGEVQRIDAHLFDDQRIACTIDEFNALASYLRHNGVPTVIADSTVVMLSAGDVVIGERLRAGALYRRAYRFPLAETSCPCINDIRLRAICPDKGWTASILAGVVKLAGAYDPSSPPNKGKRFIVKPNYGSGSEGVRRVAVEDLPAATDDICQEWIEPAKMRANARDYYFDVRVFVIDGEPVSYLVRRAAAPCDGESWLDSPLSWLTTTGPRHSLAGACLTARQKDALDRASVAAAAALDMAAQRLGFCEAIMMLRDFASLTGVTGTVQPIELAAQTVAPS